MIFQQILSFIPDLVQILILYVVLYAILRAAKGSRFGQVLMGIVLLFSFLIAISFLFDFVVLGKLVNLLLGYLAISTVVLFQPEIRSGLAKIGALLPDSKKTSNDPIESYHVDKVTPTSFFKILVRLSRSKTGGLIAFERGISLRGYQETGIPIDAIITPELISTIFFVPTPLHDGGMVIRNKRIIAAHCLFPVSRNPNLDVTGMCHRAAVGLSEETDAIVFVVSEETGTVSVARHGVIHKFDISKRASRKHLLETLSSVIPLEQLTSWELFVRRLQRKIFKKFSNLNEPTPDIDIDDEENANNEKTEEAV